MEADPPQPSQRHNSVKVRVGIFFGYNGEKFRGMQYQRETDNTVQNIMHKVLCENGFVLKSNMDSLRRIKWSRGGRTDKKVHALCNGISAGLEFDVRYIIDAKSKTVDFDKVIKDLNAQLPTDIRVFAIKRVGKSFDMRHCACSRIYNYLAPLSLFQSKQDFINGKIMNELEKQQVIDTLNRLVSNYLGTHNYYNFTRGVKADNPKCDRYMMAMSVEPVQPEVVEEYLAKAYESQEERSKHRVSFVRFRLVGQSFIYHQIRKMVGLMIQVYHEGLKGEQAIATAFKKEEYKIFLAPGQGLYLNRLTFDRYNDTKGKQRPQLKVLLNEDDEARVSRFRRELEQVIVGHEIEEQAFTQWLRAQSDPSHQIANEDESEEERSVNNE